MLTTASSGTGPAPPAGSNGATPGADPAGALRPPPRGLVTSEWLAALRRGRRPMPATVVIVVGCLGVWVASIATGGPLWNGTVHGPVDRDLARNAVLIAGGQWWRALSYATLNLSVPAAAFVLGLLLLAGLQVERTYGTLRFLAILVPAWTAGALVALLVEPAHAYNAGTSGAVFGVATAAAIDLLRRGVPWYRTFWVPVMAIVLGLGFLFPAGVTWGAHAGGILAGAVTGTVICHPEAVGERRRLALGGALAALLTAASLLAVPSAARHTADHGPVLIGAPASKDS
jgi:membrane associated rhomboid family serine protease